MDDLLLVGVGEGVADLLCQSHHGDRVQSAPRAEDLLEGGARDVLEDQIGPELLVVAHVVDLDDVRVVELGGGAGLVPESLEEELQALPVHVQVADRLDRDGSVELRVAPQEHEPHRPRSEQPVDRIATNFLGDPVFHPGVTA